MAKVNLSDIAHKPDEPMGGPGGCLCGMGKWCDICRPNQTQESNMPEQAKYTELEHELTMIGRADRTNPSDAATIFQAVKELQTLREICESVNTDPRVGDLVSVCGGEPTRIKRIYKGRLYDDRGLIPPDSYVLLEPQRRGVPVGHLDDGSIVYLGDWLTFPEGHSLAGEKWLALIGGCATIQIPNDGHAIRNSMRGGFDGMVRLEAGE